MKSGDKFDFKELASSLVIVISFWIVAIVLWRSTGDIFYLFNFLYIGTAIGIGTGFYSALPRNKKSLGRKLTLFLIGGYLFVFLGLLKFENLQIEGVFFTCWLDFSLVPLSITWWRKFLVRFCLVEHDAAGRAGL